MSAFRSWVFPIVLLAASPAGTPVTATASAPTDKCPELRRALEKADSVRNQLGTELTRQNQVGQQNYPAYLQRTIEHTRDDYVRWRTLAANPDAAVEDVGNIKDPYRVRYLIELYGLDSDPRFLDDPQIFAAAVRDFMVRKIETLKLAQERAPHLRELVQLAFAQRDQAEKELTECENSAPATPTPQPNANTNSAASWAGTWIDDADKRFTLNIAGRDGDYTFSFSYEYTNFGGTTGSGTFSNCTIQPSKATCDFTERAENARFVINNTGRIDMVRRNPPGGELWLPAAIVKWEATTVDLKDPRDRDSKEFRFSKLIYAYRLLRGE